MVTALTKVYGAADPALLDENIKWTDADGQWVGTGDDKSVFTGTLSYTYEGENVGTHDLSVTGLTADNYYLTVTGGIEITPKTITADFITAVTLSGTYKGAAYTDFAVDVKDGSTPLVAGTDFDVAVYSNPALTSGATALNYSATPYYLGIVTAATGTPNYVVTGDPLPAGTFTLNKAGLTIRALAQSKYFNNSDALPSTAEGTGYQVIGKFGTDAIGTVTLSGNTSADWKDGGYTITPSAAPENANYDYNYVTATFTINKRPITITPVAAQKVLNKNDNTAVVVPGETAGDDKATVGYAGVTVTVTGLNDGETDAAAVWTGTLKGASWANMINADKGNLRVVRTGKGTDESRQTYAGALSVTKKATDAVWKNYDVTPGTADFIITGGKIYVTALHQEKTYGEEDPSWVAALDENYIVSGLSTGESLATEPTLTCEHIEKAGAYTINISGAVAPDGYEEIVYASGTFTIKKAPLAVTLPVKTVTAGATIAATLPQVTMDGIVITGFQNGETAEQAYTLSLEAGLAVDGEDKLTNQTNAAGYILTLKDDIFANYAITGGTDEGKKLAGKLIVGTGGAVGDLVLTCVDAEYPNILAANGEKKHVTIDFTKRNRKANATAPVHTWTADNWNVLVLPFDITVAELSSKLGHADTGAGEFNYVVVNTIKEDAPAGKFQFKLFTGTLPANVPFMVKTVGDMTTADEAAITANPNINRIDFGEKTIVAPASEKVAAKFDNGFKLVGQYKDFVLDKNSTEYDGTNALFKFLYGDDDSQYRFITSTSSSAWKIVPFDGYVDLSADPVAARNVVFEFEEADGSTTTIKAIDAEADNASVKMTGWYTINGTKLQAAPTQKGIYIFNGKKLVVK